MNALSSVTSSMGYGQMQPVKPREDDLFGKVDTDGDGSLSETEMTAFSEKMAEMTGTSSDAAEMFATFDSDEDGLVSEDEFNAARPQGPPPPGGMPPGGPGSTEDAEADYGLLSSLDADGDGTVDESELTTGINSLVKAYMAQSDSLVSATDATDSISLEV